MAQSQRNHAGRQNRNHAADDTDLGDITVQTDAAEDTDLSDGALIDELDVHHPLPTGWRHGSTWVYLVMLIASAVALLVSFILSADTLQLARNPDQLLGCDVNGIISCSDVAKSWQAEIVKVGGLSYPNAFFGIAAESVFVTIAVIGLARVQLPRWFALCTWLGSLFAFCYAYWLTSQSLFVIQALCPWCLLLMASTTIQFMAVSHATVTVQRLPRRTSRLYSYYRLNYDLMVDVLWIIVVIAVILIKDGDQIFRGWLF